MTFIGAFRLNKMVTSGNDKSIKVAEGNESISKAGVLACIHIGWGAASTVASADLTQERSSVQASGSIPVITDI